MKKILSFIFSIVLIFSCLGTASSAQGDYDFEEISRELSYYYEDYDELSFRTALTMVFLNAQTGIDAEEVEERVEFKEGKSVPEIAANILYNVALGKAKEEENEKWLEMLSNSQRSDGSFYKAPGDEHLANTAWAVIALDICKYSYDEEKAAKYIMSSQKSTGEFYQKDDIDTTCMALQALSKHLDVDGVKNSVESALEFVDERQLEDGGFLFMGEENPYTICEVVQALMSLGEDIYSSRWEKDGDGLVDVLMRYYDGGTFKYKTKFGIEEKMATERSFMTIVQVASGKYMFEDAENFEGDGGGSEEPKDGDIEMELLSKEEFKDGKDAFLDIEIRNSSGEDMSGVLMVCIYDEDEEEMISYSYNYLDIESGDSTRVRSGFYIQERDEQVVRAMLFDSLNRLNQLAKPIEAEVD